jgi:very-short-patch-repair endonuclease
MKDKLQKFDNIFNCPECNKTLWQYSILKDGTKVCPECYEKIMKVENKKTEQNKGYVEKKAKELVDKGLTELVFNFFEKIYNNNPNDDEVVKLWNLFKIKHNVDIEYDSFFKIISNIYETDRQHKELESFEQQLMQEDTSADQPSEYQCVVCNKQIDKRTHEESLRSFDKALCQEHQGSENHRNLFFALKKRGVPVEFEAYDGFKHVDIAIHEIKLYIEVEGTLNQIDPNQFFEQMRNDNFSNEGNYQTKRLNNEFVSGNLDKLADTIKEVYLKSRIF